MVKIMDAFALLEDDHHRIEKQLSDFIADYDQMSNVDRFARASVIFQQTRKHFERQKDFLLKAATEKGALAFVEECLQDRKNIVDAMDNLLMSHVDDTDFSDGLRAFLRRFDEHIRHSDEKLYIEFRQQLFPRELQIMDSSATEGMLGSPL